MEEYRLKVSIRNNLILKLIEETGAKSVAEFCRNNGLSQPCVHKIIAMTDCPIKSNGEFSKIAKELMEVLGACPTDLWTSEQLNMKLSKNSHEVFMDKHSLQAAICGEATPIFPKMPDEVLSKIERTNIVNKLLDSKLSKKQKHIVRMAIDSDLEKNLTDAAKSMNLSSTRVSQIYSKSLRELRRWATKDKAFIAEIEN